MTISFKFFSILNTEYIILLGENGGKTIRVLEVGEQGLASVSCFMLILKLFL